MDDSQIWEKLALVFRAVFGRDDIVVTAATTARDVPEWDSLNHVQLVLAVESEFGIRFRTAEVAAFEHVGDMAAAVKRQLAP